MVDAPGELRGVELAVLGWTTERGEVMVCCRLRDGSTGEIPVRWTDVPVRTTVEPPSGSLASPAALRLLAARLDGLSSRCPRRPNSWRMRAR